MLWSEELSGYSSGGAACRLLFFGTGVLSLARLQWHTALIMKEERMRKSATDMLTSIRSMTSSKKKNCSRVSPSLGEAKQSKMIWRTPPRKAWAYLACWGMSTPVLKSAARTEWEQALFASPSSWELHWWAPQFHKREGGRTCPPFTYKRISLGITGHITQALQGGFLHLLTPVLLAST